MPIKRWFRYLITMCLLGGSWVLAEEKTALTCTMSGGIEAVITADGLSSIRVAGRQLATGGWTVFNAENWFKDGGSGEPQTGAVVKKSLFFPDAGQAIVRHEYPNIILTTDYRFEGDDLLISARVENNHPTDPIAIVGFQGLTLDFDQPPQGYMMTQHITYFQAHGVELCHPGYWSKIGGSYAADRTIGIGLSPWNTGIKRTLILWDWDWEPQAREKSLQRKLIYFVVDPVPPRGANTYDFIIRLSANRDWKYLLEPYKGHFLQTFGPCRYQADHRFIATDYLNHSQSAVGPDNPYGFHGGIRRIDTAAGVAAMCGQVIPAVKDGGGQGIIFWGQGGDDPREAMYRPDFDILPPAVEANWPELARRFREAGLKIGVCTRPADMALREDWRKDQVIRINPDDPGHRQMLWNRFQKMIDRGCTLFYLDSFGMRFEDVILMRYLREKLGPDILTFSEHQCDAMLPYTGGYSETTFTAAKDGAPANYRLWSGEQNWEIFRWLVPGAQMTARLYQIEGEMPADFEPVERYFFSRHISPLLPVSDFGRLPRVKAIQTEFLTPQWDWKQQ